MARKGRHRFRRYTDIKPNNISATAKYAPEQRTAKKITYGCHTSLTMSAGLII